MDSTNIGNETISLKSILIGYLRHWRLFLGTFVISLIPAVLYLIYYPTTYEVMARFKVQDDTSMSSGNMSLGDAAGLMKSFGLNGGGSAGIVIDDEVAVLKSHTLWYEVVSKLGLNAEYVEPLTWKYKQYVNTPFLMVADSSTLKSQEETIEFYVREDREGKIKIEGKTKSQKRSYEFSSLPAIVEFGNNRFILSYGANHKLGESMKLYITMRPAGFVGDDFAQDIEIETYSDNSNVIECTLREYEKKRGIDVLNALMFEYNNRADSINNKEARATIQFLDERINKVISDLANAERSIEIYKKNNQMTDLTADVQFYVDQMKEIQTKIVEMEAQGHAIRFMEDFVQNPANKYNLVPVLMNVQEGEKGGSITTYNELLVNRQRMLQNSKEDNPLFTVMDKQLDQMRKSVALTIKNAQESLNLTLKDLKSKEKAILDKMGNVPTQEREFMNYKRDQEIAQGVYLILLQKREEALLKLNKSMNRALIVDEAFVKSTPVAPRKLYAALAVFLLTIVVPVVYLFCKEQLIELKREYDKTRKQAGVI